MKTPFFGLFGAVILALTSVSLHAEPTLVGHAELEAKSLDADAVKAVLLGKRVTLGTNRVVLIIIKSSAAQDAFLESHVGMNTSQFQNHWRRLFMTGGGSAPKIVETETEACKLATATKGAVLIADSASAEGLVILVKN